MDRQLEIEAALSWRKLAYVAFAGLLVLLVLGGGYSLFIFESMSAQAEKENLAADQALVEIGAQFLGDHQKGLLDRLEAIASRATFKRALRQRDLPEAVNFLQTMARASAEVETVFVADPDGVPLVAQHPLPPSLEPHSGLPPAAMRIQGPHEPFVSTVHRSPMPPHQLVTTLSAPILDADGRLLGYLGLTQRGDYWNSFFSRLSARPGRTFHLFDQDGALVAYGRESGEAEESGLLELALIMRQAQIKQGSTATTLGQIPGTPYHAFISAAAVADTGWVLVVSHDYSAAMAPTRAMLKNTAFFMVLLFACLGLLGYLLLSRYRIQQRLLARRDEEARLLEDTVRQRTADLIRSTERYKSLVADLPDMVYEMDAGGRLTFVSRAVEAILGYQPREMVGKLRRAYVLPEDRHLFDEELARWAKGENISILALRHLAKDGRERWLSVHSRGIFDEDGKMIGRRGVARDVTQQILAERRVRELSHRLINAQEEERKRVALDLHDEMGQLLSALKIGLQSFAEQRGPDEGGELERLIRLSQKIMDRIRALAYHLRPAILDNFGLVAAVEDLCDSLAESGLIEVERNLAEVDEKSLSPETKTALFRFVQESLTNAVKHAESPRALVSMSCEAGHLTMSVRDWGKGFNVDQALGGLGGDKHLGLLGMGERISLVGGTLEISSTSDQGSLLTARLPLVECGC